MTWNDFYQRQHAVQQVLEHAREHGAEAATLENVPQARAAFSDSEELLNALQYKWSQLLLGRIGLALTDAETDPHGDRVQAVTTAWRQTAAANPTLRAILDHHPATPEAPMRDALEREQRLLALASGLAESHEPTHDIARVGSAFRRLLQMAPAEEPRRRKGALSHLRKLIPSI